LALSVTAAMPEVRDSENTAPVWVPGAKSKPLGDPFDDGVPYFIFEPLHSVRHTRHGKADAVRGTNLIVDGHFRVEYTVCSATHGGSGFGIVVGVTDAEAPAWIETTTKPGEKPKLRGKSCVAWGLCLSSGRLITTHDPHKGRFDGASVGEELTARKRSKAGESTITGMTIAIECDIPAHNSLEDEISSKRSYTHTLHPLDGPRNFPLHMESLQERSVHALTGSPVTKPGWLSFSVDGGEMVRTRVQLPACGVYPWVLLTGDGDEVTMTSCKKLSPDF